MLRRPRRATDDASAKKWEKKHSADAKMSGGTCSKQICSGNGARLCAKKSGTKRTSLEQYRVLSRRWQIAKKRRKSGELRDQGASQCRGMDSGMGKRCRKKNSISRKNSSSTKREEASTRERERKVPRRKAKPIDRVPGLPTGVSRDRTLMVIKKKKIIGRRERRLTRKVIYLRAASYDKTDVSKEKMRGATDGEGKTRKEKVNRILSLGVRGKKKKPPPPPTPPPPHTPPR